MAYGTSSGKIKSLNHSLLAISHTLFNGRHLSTRFFGLSTAGHLRRGYGMEHASSAPEHSEDVFPCCTETNVLPACSADSRCCS